jgi:hypothetical protein
MNLRALRAPAKRFNPDVHEEVRAPEESNLDWIRRVAGLGRVPDDPGWSLILLVGGNDPMSFRLRVAQAHIRHDLSPSAWSHALFVTGLAADLGSSATVEISLAPPGGFGSFGFPVPNNGIQSGRLDTYESAERFPNIALLAVPVPSSDIAASLDALRPQRSIFDALQLIVRWLSYCWGIGVPASPLAEGMGIPGAAVLETAFAAKGFDLTPGLESQSSCPEAIWQAAAWWHGYYEKVADTNRAMMGAFSAKHDLIPEKLYLAYGAPLTSQPPQPPVPAPAAPKDAPAAPTGRGRRRKTRRTRK